MSDLLTFDIECGRHVGTVVAPSIEEAWAKLTKGKNDGFSELVRWRYRSDNGKVILSVWNYQTPQSLEKIEP